jgi:hypothetical protein
MADELIDLRGVNWSQGMFLTPEHFLRQERYVDSLWLWLVRFSSTTHGLLGGGPRVDAAERGAARFDPIVDLEEGPESIKVTVVQCRGITAGGAAVDVDSTRSISAAFPKRDLDGAQELGVYVLARPHDKEPDDGVADPINPQIQAARRASYRVRLDVTAEEAPWGLLLARLRRSATGLQFERVPGFIPPCALMCAHSSLMDAFRHLNDSVSSLADRYSRLHRAIVDFIALARARGLAIDQDVETLAFVGRMVLALEDCAYAMLDPLQPPRQFLQNVDRMIRSAALFLSLSPPTREYFRLLGEIAGAEFASMLEQDGQALESGRRLSLTDADLQVGIQKLRRALDRVDRLEQALEGKYLDYRVSPSLESLNFVFDRTGGDPVLYKSVAKPARPQAHGSELTFVFAPLRLEARETYRIVLVGDRQASFGQGDRLSAELRINPGEGYSQAPEHLIAEFEVDGQRNFALDFKAPGDVVTITDLRVSLRSTQPIRSAILYVRGRLLAGPPPAAPPIVSTTVPQVKGPPWPELAGRYPPVPAPPRRLRDEAAGTDPRGEPPAPPQKKGRLS